MKESEDLIRYEHILKVVANRRRLAILRYLNKVDDANVGDISETIGLSFKSTSRHLAVLLSEHLVEKEQKGTFVFYSLSFNKQPILAKLYCLL